MLNRCSVHLAYLGMGIFVELKKWASPYFSPLVSPADIPIASADPSEKETKTNIIRSVTFVDDEAPLSENEKMTLVKCLQEEISTRSKSTSLSPVKVKKQPSASAGNAKDLEKVKLELLQLTGKIARLEQTTIDEMCKKALKPPPRPERVKKEQMDKPSAKNLYPKMTLKFRISTFLLKCYKCKLTFKCDFCKNTFTMVKDWNAHHQLKHKKVFKCKTCAEIIKVPSSFKSTLMVCESIHVIDAQRSSIFQVSWGCTNMSTFDRNNIAVLLKDVMPYTNGPKT